MGNIKFELPTNLEPEAKKYIYDVIQMLNDTGLIDNVDEAAIKMLAYNYSTFIKANKIIEKDGLTVVSDRGNIAEHPAVKIAKDAQTQALKVMAEFGLTAKSRSKMIVNKSDEEESPFEQFIKQGKEVR